LALSVPPSRFTSRVGGGSAFYVRPLRITTFMGFITDILKEVPLSAVLREKLVTAEKQIALGDTQTKILETENANLRELVKQKDGEIDRLKKQVESLKQPIARPSFSPRRRDRSIDG
jgi:hypothetical protein